MQTVNDLDLAQETRLVFGLDLLQEVCFGGSAAKGFWGDGDPMQGEYNFGEKIALVHSELSEALEANRKNLASDHLPHRTGVEEEFADAIIRICDLAQRMNISLADVILEKLEFNQTRPFKHGKAY